MMLSFAPLTIHFKKRFEKIKCSQPTFGKESKNASKQTKKELFFEKISNFKKDAFKAEFTEQFTIDTFLTNITHFR